MKVAADLLERGCQIAFPFVEDCDYDLIADRDGMLHRKYYTAAIIDWIAVYDRTTDRCYYCPASELGAGRCSLSLRLTPARNGQVLRVRNASDYTNPDFSRPQQKVEPAGFEPATFAMQARRSAS